MTDANKEEKVISAIILQDVECPICKFAEVKNYSLKAKTLPIRHNVFQVPIYEENPKYFHVDFNELQFTVCPVCYYVGANKSEFNSFNSLSGTEKHTDTDKRIINYWEANSKQIKAQFSQIQVNEESFLDPRPAEAVLLSVNLAIYKATVEIHGKVPYSMIKRAHRYLRLYSLKFKYNKVMDDSLLKKTVADLEEVFRLSDFPEKAYEFEVCYLIVACSIKLGDETKAGEYIKVLDITKAELAQEAKTNPKVPLQEVTKWSTKAKELWQNRQDPEIWNL
ncbi:DUF2225 domain-containing protein [Leptospira idonii]|uniref:DUF2225 domain-containing protein n=1 Tax=Leptospira idonii TaxID=1193500 RepID=UPI0014385F3B|nr:DUF2225 domain-containing protein [Leptospira idonii]